MGARGNVSKGPKFNPSLSSTSPLPFPSPVSLTWEVAQQLAVNGEGWRRRVVFNTE